MANTEIFDRFSVYWLPTSPPPPRRVLATLLLLYVTYPSLSHFGGSTIASYLLNAGVGVRIPLPSAIVVLQFASCSRKNIKNLQFAVQIEIFPKTLFLPYHHLLWALLNHTCMKNMFLVGFLGKCVIYSEQNLRSVGHLQKYVVSARLNLFEKRHAHI